MKECVPYKAASTATLAALLGGGVLSCSRGGVTWKVNTDGVERNDELLIECLEECVLSSVL